MKTQFSFRKYGFTLVEITIVITILGFLFYTFWKVSFRPQENIIKAERLANKIVDVLHESLININIGRMDSTRTPVSTAYVYISTSTGISWYYSPTLSWTFVPPFYDEDVLYEIRDITWTGWKAAVWAVSGTTPFLGIIMEKNRISFTGITNDTAFLVTIRTRYQDMNKKVVFDRRTGRIEVNKE